MAVEKLHEGDAATLRDTGARPQRVRALFEAEDWSLEIKRAQGQPPLRERLRALVDELRGFETKLQTPPSPYR